MCLFCTIEHKISILLSLGHYICQSHIKSYAWTAYAGCICVLVDRLEHHQLTVTVNTVSSVLSAFVGIMSMFLHLFVSVSYVKTMFSFPQPSCQRGNTLNIQVCTLILQFHIYRSIMYVRNQSIIQIFCTFIILLKLGVF